MAELDQLAWENFERLCLRLASERGTVDHLVDHAEGDTEVGRMSAREARARPYSVRSQNQQGIDLYLGCCRSATNWVYRRIHGIT